MTSTKKLRSLNRRLRKWVRASAYRDSRFVRLDFNAFSNRFCAVGCDGDRRTYKVIVSARSGSTPEKAISNMLKHTGF